MRKIRQIIFFVGATFAWFTSTDEVTNRLSAKADFNNVFTETFEPPTDWVPGEEVNKDVTVLNTGNIDSLLKVDFDAVLNLTTVNDTGESFNSSNVATYVKLTEAEAIAKQAGGFVLYAKDAAVAAADQKIPAGTIYATGGSDKAGAYVFIREIKDDSGTKSYDLDGYYYDGTNYYAITPVGTVASTTTNGDTTYSYTSTSNNVKTITTTQPPLTWDYTNATATGKKIVASYTDNGKKVSFTIALDNIAGDTIATNQWQKVTVTGASTPSFFYTNDLDAGQASAKLVDSVTFDKESDMQFYALDFDLTLKLNSEQITKNESGLELIPGATAANSKQTDVLSAAAQATTMDSNEISIITWSAS